MPPFCNDSRRATAANNPQWKALTPLRSLRNRKRQTQVSNPKIHGTHRNPRETSAPPTRRMTFSTLSPVCIHLCWQRFPKLRGQKSACKSSARSVLVNAPGSTNAIGPTARGKSTLTMHQAFRPCGRDLAEFSEMMRWVFPVKLTPNRPTSALPVIFRSGQRQTEKGKGDDKSRTTIAGDPFYREWLCGAGQGCRGRILERLYIDNCLPLTVELFHQLAFFILSCKPISYCRFKRIDVYIL